MVVSITIEHNQRGMCILDHVSGGSVLVLCSEVERCMVSYARITKVSCYIYGTRARVHARACMRARASPKGILRIPLGDANARMELCARE